GGRLSWSVIHLAGTEFAFLQQPLYQRAIRSSPQAKWARSESRGVPPWAWPSAVRPSPGLWCRGCGRLTGSAGQSERVSDIGGPLPVGPLGPFRVEGHPDTKAGQPSGGETFERRVIGRATGDEGNEQEHRAAKQRWRHSAGHANPAFWSGWLN